MGGRKLKLLLVLTGGTISTIVKNNVLGISGNSPYVILEKYRKSIENTKEFPEFDIIEPVRILSECSEPKVLEQIYYGILEKLGLGKNAIEVREENKKRTLQKQNLPYDGIIVTHGSDTLSYTAAFLAVTFSFIEIPLVLTAADYPLSDRRSNGLKNFSDAVDFIRYGKLQGVFTIWQNRIVDNSSINGNLFSASELLEADTCRDCFSSYSGQALGKIEHGVCTIFQKERELYNDKKLFDLHIEQEILFLRPYPGLRYDLLALEHTNIRAVVHYLYHSGTAYVKEQKQENKKYNVLTFANYCKTLGIDLYFAGLKEDVKHLYETNNLLLKSGLGKAMYHISPEMAYMKVLIAYNQTVMPRNVLFKKGFS